jgi:hypothetical protein
MVKAVVSDKEEQLFIQNKLSEMGLDLPDFFVGLFIRLHWKYMEEKGLIPKDKNADKMLAKIKKELTMRFEKKEMVKNG